MALRMFLFDRSLAQESIHFVIINTFNHFCYLRDFKDPVFCEVAPIYVKKSISLQV